MSVRGAVTRTGGVAHVVLYPDSTSPIKLDLIMVLQSGRLLVDDMQCSDRGPATSVYAPQLVSCG